MSKLDIEATKFKRKYSNIRDQLPDIGHENGVFVFPYKLRSGYLNRTESGYVWSDDEVDEHTFFQKLITGKDNINVVWENSTTLTKPKGVNRYYYKFEVGKYYLGEIVGNEVFANTQFYDDELGQKNIKVNNTIVLHFVYNKENDEEQNFPNLRPFYVEKEDMFKLYKIPQLFGEEWMYISDVRYETIPNDNEIVGCFITFVSLNEQLSKSGRTIESYIHESAPNEPYAKPLLSEEKNEKGETIYCVKLDENAKSFDRKMVKHIQVEIYGTNALSAITIIGRRLKKDEEGKPYFSTWQFLFPYSFIKPKTYNLEKTSTPSNNFYIFPNCELEFTKSINWIEQWKKVSDVVATNSFTGILKIGSSKDWSGEVHNSNPINTSSTVINGLHYDYWSFAWKPFRDIIVAQQFNLTKDNPYCVNNLWFTQDDSFLDILIKNSFIYWQQLELPLGFAMTKPYKLSNFPIFGGMVSALGGDRTLLSNTARKKTIPICCIIDCAAATCGANILVGGEGSVDIKNIPLSFFGGEEVPKFLGVDVCNTTLCFSLTHLLVDNNGKEWDTSYLGQLTNENLEPLFDDVKKPFQYDGTQKTKDSEEGYIIDKVIIQGLIKSDIKITFFDKDEELANPLWTTKVQSQGKYTNSLRNWTTEITTGCWNDKYVEFSEDFTWPENPPHGIIYNQSPNYTPFVRIKNQKGVYELSTRPNEKKQPSTMVDEKGRFIYRMFGETIKIDYYTLDSTQQIIYDKQSFIENVKTITFIFNYSFSLIPRKDNEEIYDYDGKVDFERINVSNTRNISFDISERIGSNGPIFSFSEIMKSGDFIPSQRKIYKRYYGDINVFPFAYNNSGIGSLEDWNWWRSAEIDCSFGFSTFNFKEDSFEINPWCKLLFTNAALDVIDNVCLYYLYTLQCGREDMSFTASVGGYLNIKCELVQINFELKSEEE